MRSSVPTIIFLLLSPAIVFALGLGDIAVDSALNQPLKARIELLSPSPDELDTLKVTLADSNTFAKAGIDRPFILGKLRFNLQRSDDDSPDHISVSTQIPIREPFLNFLIEVAWSTGRILREYTILLDPPSYDFRSRVEKPVNQDPIPEDASQWSEVSTSSPVTNFTGSDYGPTARLDTLSEIADKTRPDKSINLNKMMIAIFRANPEAFINQNINGLKGGYVLRIPDEAMINELTSTEALEKVRSHHVAWGDMTFTRDTVTQEQPQHFEGADISEGEISGVDETGVTDPELRLVVADDGVEATQETGELEPTKSNDLLVAEETIETLTQENFELKARLKELETLVEQLQPLLTLKDDELAVYQAQLATQDTTNASEAEVAVEVEEVLEEVLAEVEVGTTEEEVGTTEEEGFEEEGFEEEGFEEADTAEEISELSSEVDEYTQSVERDAALVKEALSPFDSIIEKIKNIFGVKFGIAILAILAFLLILLRFRKEPVETVHIEPIDDAELAEINKEVTDLMDDAAATQSPDSKTRSEDKTVIAPQDNSLDNETSTDDETTFSEDPDRFMEEVNTYIAFEQFDEAEKTLRSAISDEPDNHELHLKLLEVFYTAGNKEEYEKAANTISNKFGTKSEVWDKTLTMWQEMTGSPLPVFASDGSEDETMAIGAVDDSGEDETMIVASDGSEDETMAIGAVDDSGEDETIIVADDGSEDETIAIGADDDDLNIEFPSTEENGESEIDISDSNDNDFEIDLSVSEDDDVNNEEIVALDETSDNLEATEFDLEIGELSSSDDDEISVTEETKEDQDDQGVELEISLDDDENISNENSQRESHADFVEQVAQSEDLSVEDVVATKLDLAKAYVEVSDNDNAKTILNEVLAEGDEDQRKQAQTLLDQI